jgi:hypothetical protein
VRGSEAPSLAPTGACTGFEGLALQLTTLPRESVWYVSAPALVVATTRNPATSIWV